MGTKRDIGTSRQARDLGFQCLEARVVLAASGIVGNEPPDLVLPEIAESVSADQTLTFNLFDAGASVSDGQTASEDMRLQLDPDETPEGAQINSDGTFSWTPTSSQVGEHVIRVIAIDDGSPALADVETFTVTVLEGLDNSPITVEKTTNGEDADEAPGPNLAVGSTATFDYTVTNSGAVPLSNVALTDDNGTPSDTSDDITPNFVGGDTDGDEMLDADETWTYQATATVVAGQYTNVSTVTATDADGSEVSDTDASNHFGVDSGIDIEKSTNGLDSDEAPGEDLIEGSTATFTYTVTNPGNSPLANVVVSDDNGTPDDTSDDITPAFESGDTNGDEMLDTDETWTFTASRIVTVGQFTNIGSVTADDPLGQQVADADASNHNGVALNSAVVLEKTTNGEDADEAPGPNLAVGSTATFDYTLTNGGNNPLGSVVLTDDNGTPDDTSDDITPAFVGGDADGDEMLDTDETWTYQATATVVAGQYTNVSTVTAIDAGGSEVSDTDASNHFGVGGSIDIEKRTNGIDSDDAPGQQIAAGSEVTFTYLVENTGNVPLTNIVVQDDQLGEITTLTSDGNGDDVLDVGELWIYETTSTATVGEYVNTGSVTADDPLEGQVTDSDLSHYTGFLTSNNPPDLHAIDDQAGVVGEELMLTAVATDPDPGDVLTFSLDPDDSPAGATIDPVTGELRFTPTEAGEVSVTVIVTDTGRNADQETFFVNVVEAIQSPDCEVDLMSIANQTAFVSADGVGEELTVNTSAIDAHGGAITYSLDADDNPAGAAIDPETGVLTWTPSIDDVGQTVGFTVQASNANGVFDTETFDVMVEQRTAGASDGAIAGLESPETSPTADQQAGDGTASIDYDGYDHKGQWWRGFRQTLGERVRAAAGNHEASRAEIQSVVAQALDHTFGDDSDTGDDSSDIMTDMPTESLAASDVDAFFSEIDVEDDSEMLAGSVA